MKRKMLLPLFIFALAAVPFAAAGTAELTGKVGALVVIDDTGFHDRLEGAIVAFDDGEQYFVAPVTACKPHVKYQVRVADGGTSWAELVWPDKKHLRIDSRRINLAVFRLQEPFVSASPVKFKDMQQISDSDTIESTFAAQTGPGGLFLKEPLPLGRGRKDVKGRFWFFREPFTSSVAGAPIFLFRNGIAFLRGIVYGNGTLKGNKKKGGLAYTTDAILQTIDAYRASQRSSPSRALAFH